MKPNGMGHTSYDYYKWESTWIAWTKKERRTGRRLFNVAARRQGKKEVRQFLNTGD